MPGNLIAFDHPPNPGLGARENSKPPPYMILYNVRYLTDRTSSYDRLPWGSIRRLRDLPSFPAVEGPAGLSTLR